MTSTPIAYGDSDLRVLLNAGRTHSFGATPERSGSISEVDEQALFAKATGGSDRVLGLAGLAVAGALFAASQTPVTILPMPPGSTIVTNAVGAGAARLRVDNFVGFGTNAPLEPIGSSGAVWPESKLDTADVSPLTAVEELKQWLSLNDSEVSALGGFSRRTLVNWRGGSDAYGSSTRQLFAVHALVAALREAWGDRATRLWFESATPDGLVRRVAIASEMGGLQQAISEVSTVLFGAIPSPLQDPNIGLTDREMSEYLARSTSETPLGDVSPKRVRRPSRDI